MPRHRRWVPMVPMVPSLGRTSTGEKAQAINEKTRKAMPGEAAKTPVEQPGHVTELCIHNWQVHDLVIF